MANFYGNTKGNRIAGTDSDDSIFGYAGSDILIGGAGNRPSCR